MNQNYSRDQFFRFKNFQTVATNLASQTNLATDPRMNIPMTAQGASIHSSNQHYENPPAEAYIQQPLINMATANPPTVHDNFIHYPIEFFYQPPNDLLNYCIKCEEISFGVVNNF